MAIENMRWWQWAVLGGGMGALVAFVKLSAGSDGMGEGLPSVKSQAFEQDLTQKLPNGQPALQNIVIHPASDGKNLVTFEREKGSMFRGFQRRDGNSKEISLVEHKLIADIPYKPVSRRGAKMGPDYTIRNYLDDVAKRNPSVTYKYAWWEEPKKAYALLSGGGAVLIGGIWPVILRLLIGAGFARPPQEPEYDLSRFKGEKTTSKETVSRPNPEDDPELARLEEEMLRRLEEDDALRREEPTPVVVAQPAPIRKLINGKPAEEITAQVSGEEHKEYRGEYYPVVKSVEELKAHAHPDESKPTQ